MNLIFVFFDMHLTNESQYFGYAYLCVDERFSKCPLNPMCLKIIVLIYFFCSCTCVSSPPLMANLIYTYINSKAPAGMGRLGMTLPLRCGNVVTLLQSHTNAMGIRGD